MSSQFSHVNSKGKAEMVDVSEKPDQIRKAVACGHIYLAEKTIRLIKSDEMKKGDVLSVAQIAGITGGKKTSELIPLCHPLLISKIDVKLSLTENSVYAESFARCTGKTGIEMEALMAVSIALLTVYDMCKAVDKSMTIGDIRLLEKIKF